MSEAAQKEDSRAVYESLLQSWEWSIEDEEGNHILSPEVRRVILDISPDRSLTATVFFYGEVDETKKMQKFTLRSAGITEDIKDNCEFKFERLAEENESEYLLKFALKME